MLASSSMDTTHVLGVSSIENNDIPTIIFMFIVQEFEMNDMKSLDPLPVRDMYCNSVTLRNMRI